MEPCMCGWKPCPKQAKQTDPTYICDPQCIECISVARPQFRADNPPHPPLTCDCIGIYLRLKGWD